MFEHFLEGENFTVCQSGFLTGDSCPSQLLSIIHKIQNTSPPIVHLWHNWIVYKINENNINILKYSLIFFIFLVIFLNWLKIT